MPQHAASGNRSELPPVAKERGATGYAETRARYNLTGTRVIRVTAPGADDISLGILEKRCERIDPYLRPVLLVHGATIGATLFDLPLPSYSLMSNLANAGRAVYAVDIRGFGHSLNGLVMSAPPDANTPFPKLNEAVSDIGAAVDLIRAREGIDAIDLAGFSWGTVTSACYAGKYPEKIARLALYAPLYGEVNTMWLDRIADSYDRNRLRSGIGAYRFITQADLIARWDSDLPTANPSLYREGGLPQVLFEALSALDPGTCSNGLPAFRCPSGALADLLTIFNGRPLYDPGKLTMPTLLLRGSNDTTATDTDGRRLLSAIGSREKEYRIIEPGSHFLCVEKNRSELYQQLNRFFDSRNKQSGDAR